MGIAIGNQINQDLELGELISFQYDQNGRVVSYQVNVALEAQIQRNIQSRVEQFLKLLTNLGPKIPVNLEVIGFVNTKVETLISGMKINSVHIEPVVHINVEIRTVIPFGSKIATIDQSIPIGSGEVPLYYNTNPIDNIPLSIPLDPVE